jgi:tetratricopeptide (TPR) repeat protein
MSHPHPPTYYSRSLATRHTSHATCTHSPSAPYIGRYTYMEEMLGNVVNARQIFERWMQWHPDEQAWQAYINFELRYQEMDKVRAIYERFVMCHGTSNPPQCTPLPPPPPYSSLRVLRTLHVSPTRVRPRIFFVLALARVPRWRCAPPICWSFLYVTPTHTLTDPPTHPLLLARIVHSLAHSSTRPFKHLLTQPTNSSHPPAGEPKHWLKYANFEMFHGDLVNARAVYERAVEYFGEDNMDPDLYLSFAKFEESCKEHERARAIYQLALAKIPKAR